jgi:lipopolysaccharide transport system ATP-binding protein
VTHWKAGSQWIHRILLRAAWRLVVRPAGDGRQFLREPVLPGMVYPTLYVTREQFERVSLPARWHRFVVIRDLRDTLVSAYYSLAFSHRADAPGVTTARQALATLSREEGLHYLLEHWLPACARIQASWLHAGEPVIRFEDLLQDDVGILERVLVRECELPVRARQVRRAILDNRFERRTGGRRRGVEDVRAHERKAVPGEWREHFTPALREQFKRHYGALLLRSGYETDPDW